LRWARARASGNRRNGWQSWKPGPQVAATFATDAQPSSLTVEEAPATKQEPIATEPLAEPAAVPPEEVDAERVVSTPAPPQTAQPATLKERFGTQWVVWIGGLALALGAIFLVRYTVGLAIVIGLERVRLRTPEMEILRARQSMLPAR
jgi:uncharacterized membrane protein